MARSGVLSPGPPGHYAECMDPTTGRIVHYRLTENDVAHIKRDRDLTAASGRAPHYGNEPHAGDVVPMVVVRVWPNNLVNGQAVLDGNDALWVTSAPEGDYLGTWAWPPRA